VFVAHDMAHIRARPRWEIARLGSTRLRLTRREKVCAPTGPPHACGPHTVAFRAGRYVGGGTAVDAMGERLRGDRNDGQQMGGHFSRHCAKYAYGFKGTILPPRHRMSLIQLHAWPFEHISYPDAGHGMAPPYAPTTATTIVHPAALLWGAGIVAIVQAQARAADARGNPAGGSLGCRGHAPRLASRSRPDERGGGAGCTNGDRATPSHVSLLSFASRLVCGLVSSPFCSAGRCGFLLGESCG
jgi:hypothetical protein